MAASIIIRWEKEEWNRSPILDKSEDFQGTL